VAASLRAGLSRVPIRARLTVAFALATAAVLVAAGAYVYGEVSTDLNEIVDAGLRSRAEDLAQATRRRPAALPPAATGFEDSEESFAQVLTPSSRVLASRGALRGAALRPAELRAAMARPVTLEHRLPGLVGEVRVRAQRTVDRRGRPVVVAVGQSLDDRDGTLAGLVAAFAVGAPVAVLVASMLGYLLAAAGLRPVEAMRVRAREVSLTRAGEELPLPAARDEIRRLGETLNEMLSRLRGSFERERRFVADASHELRTPVAVIKTELEAALRTGDYGSQVRESLAAAVEECDHLAQLAEDLLVLARAGEGELPVRREPLRARALLDSVADRFVDRAAQHGRSIRVDPAEELVLSADPLRMRQALGNLVDNALRHGAGEVTLTARSDGPGRTVLEVADAGAGFDQELAGEAFERFVRGDPARTRGGAGLGLAIVQAIAQAHGGGAEIVAGAGGRVRVRLPVDGADLPTSSTAGGF
jgi:two-component system, OmpR family, sensor kinase